jgi:hypothetical protein
VLSPSLLPRGRAGAAAQEFAVWTWALGPNGRNQQYGVWRLRTLEASFAFVTLYVDDGLLIINTVRSTRRSAE